MAGTTTLHYGGTTHELDHELAELFIAKVERVFESDNGIAFVEATLKDGGKIQVAVSKSIPLAIEWKPKKGASFV
ncbi:hypothetical protein [Nocardia sp. SC052]|uniref:hypothetical protein n=1 Tax=Nocardia sichangensis TaxID=3385975 RepID=UPI00399F7A7E